MQDKCAVCEVGKGGLSPEAAFELGVLTAKNHGQPSRPRLCAEHAARLEERSLADLRRERGETFFRCKAMDTAVLGEVGKRIKVVIRPDGIEGFHPYRLCMNIPLPGFAVVHCLDVEIRGDRIPWTRFRGEREYLCEDGYNYQIREVQFQELEWLLAGGVRHDRLRLPVFGDGDAIRIELELTGYVPEGFTRGANFLFCAYADGSGREKE